jgi:transketolase
VSSSCQDDLGTCGKPFIHHSQNIKFMFKNRALVNGIALANCDETIFCLGSDDSQQEGNDAEAARLAAAQGLNVKLVIDVNDVTIAGHQSISKDTT